MRRKVSFRAAYYAALIRPTLADLRKVLFMPALATYGRKKAFVSFIERLKASGKAPKEIVVALMRKIITIAQAVLKSQTPFKPELHAN